MEISLVYEDKDFFVIDKPSGLITHPKNAEDKQPSVVDWVLKNYPDLAKVGDFFIASGAKVPRAGIVHRLDKDTSGLMLIAKNNDAFFYFQKLFHDKKVQKKYIALAEGTLNSPNGTINSPLGRIGIKRTTQITGKKLIDKKEAETEYKVLKSYSLLSKSYSLLELTPKTGRTHQLRVHLKSIGHPIICDPVYGQKGSCPPELGRLFLHAQKISLTLPSGQSLTVESDLPSDLEDFLNSLDQPRTF